MTYDNADKLRSINNFEALIEYLRDELDWPIEEDNYEDLMFEYEPQELGLDEKSAAKVNCIKQLRPLSSEQPWGIFFIDFEPKRLPIVALRRILSHLVIKKRQTADSAYRPVWQRHDLLFISSYGESQHRNIAFAQFFEDPNERGDLPTLRVLQWDDENTVSRLDSTHQTLKHNLCWPDEEDNLDEWRQNWSQAFTLKLREVITTSKALSIRLAELARMIRKRVNSVLAIESENGPIRKQMEAFKEALIHDLSEDDFADMYAQTITYGLLSARVSRPAGLVADNITDMVPITNPFLKDLLSTFLTVGGRRAHIDFDELGVNEVVETLRVTRMEEVLKDFDDKNPQEDPVVHFYELFLKEYDSEKRMKRGVFYTPKPVVSFIVRSVHEILIKEFGLEDGLADTATWGDMKKRHPELKIPDGAKADTPFVQILDPATGTGTFLVEVITVIYETMRYKWLSETKSTTELNRRWNDYVADHLLPRLYGFELLMAPYAVAHMKIGLKLSETGYKFQSHERARIYLTNALEEPKPFSQTILFNAPALAHEAQAVNAVKESIRFTVVIGNPPYAGHSANKSWEDDAKKIPTTIGRLLQDYYKVDGNPLGERNPKWLQDDYVKFIRFAQYTISKSGNGVHSFITNHSYLDNQTFRGMRQCLLNDFNKISVIDLHGNTKKKDKAPDGSKDENVFDIQQGVAVCLLLKKTYHFKRPKGTHASVFHGDVWGVRCSKYNRLIDYTNSIDRNLTTIKPQSPFYLFIPCNVDLFKEYECMNKITDYIPINSVGIVTARDKLTIQFTAERMLEIVEDFAMLPEKLARDRYHLGKDVQDWRVLDAQRDLVDNELDSRYLSRIYYRPFDTRFTYYTGQSRGFICRPRVEVMRHMLQETNLGLMTTRKVEVGNFGHVICINTITESHSVSLKEINYLFPLYLYPDPNDLLESVQQTNAPGNRCPNLSPEFIRDIDSKLSMKFIQDGKGDLKNNFGPEDIFNYIYAALHSPAYRERYAEFLKIDFPRVPLTSDTDLFRELCGLGDELVAYHLMNKDITPLTDFPVSGDNLVEKPKYKDDGNGEVWINKTQYFDGVPQEVWEFCIGGYQVCHKWLKDRKGRQLTDEDIEHYKYIVVALQETIRLMSEIDDVIEDHGGWPDAFVTD